MGNVKCFGEAGKVGDWIDGKEAEEGRQAGCVSHGHPNGKSQRLANSDNERLALCLLITEFGCDFSFSVAKKIETVSVGFVIGAFVNNKQCLSIKLLYLHTHYK